MIIGDFITARLQQARYTRVVDTCFISDRPITLSGALLERLKAVGFFDDEARELHECDEPAAHEEHQADTGAAIILESDDAAAHEPQACRRPAATSLWACWSYVPRIPWESTKWPCGSHWSHAGPCRDPAAWLLHT